MTSVCGRPFVKRFALCYRTVVLVCVSCVSCLFVTLVYCDQTVGWLNMKLGMEVGLCPGHIVLDGNPTPHPSPKRGAQRPPHYSAHVLQSNGSMDQGAPHYIIWGPTSPKGAQPPTFGPCCGQTAGWIKMPLGRKVDLGPGDIVLHGDPAPPPMSPISTTVEHVFKKM